MILLFVLNTFLGFFSQNVLLIVNIIIMIATYFLVGFQKDKSIVEKDVILMILIGLLSYYIIVYLFGLFIGFSANIYRLEIRNILLNTVPVILSIISFELLRYMLIFRAKYKNSLLALIIIGSILFQNSIVIRDLITQDGLKIFYVIESCGLFIVPSIMTNIYLTYQTSKTGYKSSIIYRLLMEIPLFLIPILPNFGNYVESVIRISIPTFLLIFLYRYFDKKEQKILVVKNNVNYFLGLVVFSVCFVIVYFVSGLFRYQAFVIATGSMVPEINIGDVVIVDKKVDVNSLKLGQIVAYKKDNIVVCHRINDMMDSGDKIFFETKGDNNDSVDQLLVRNDQIIGTANFKIKYIGYPTVWLNSLK